MMQNALAKCIVVSGILLAVSTFVSVVNLVNSYDAFIHNVSSHAVAAFDG